eukprot:maker-scaffold339_size202159-snap-gene-1.18 protein:Tk01772 transcript:maker-scaffold339_size202159-snap-gene-1.18-mRNA-1 annotation:"hypothetical protein CAPTEDRAFT_205745"
MRHIAILGFVAIVVSLGSADGLRCYTCISGLGRDCNDLANAEETECVAGELHCTKIVLGEDVTRACFTGRKSQQVGCQENGNTINCICDGDLCNGANGLKSASMILSIPLAVLLSVLLR